jgi:hypothetical protein
MKVMQHKTGRMKPVESFQTLEEEANYWDSHDVTQDIDKNTIIGFHKANKTETLTVRFEEGDIQELRQKSS